MTVWDALESASDGFGLASETFTSKPSNAHGPILKRLCGASVCGPSAARGDPDARGVTLDFILDTAANTNTISAQIASGEGGLGLDVVAQHRAGERTL